MEEKQLKQELMQKDKETLVELLLQKMFDCKVVEQELAKLKSKYEDCDKERLENRMEYLTMKNKWLNSEQQLAELKEKAIVPKFKIGQECWGIVPKTFWNEESYTIHFKVKAYIPDNNGIVLMLEDGITNLHYSYEYQVFATEQEAQEKLKELQGNE